MTQEEKTILCLIKTMRDFVFDQRVQQPTSVSYVIISARSKVVIMRSLVPNLHVYCCMCCKLLLIVSDLHILTVFLYLFMNVQAENMKYLDMQDGELVQEMYLFETKTRKTSSRVLSKVSYQALAQHLFSSNPQITRAVPYMNLALRRQHRFF